MDFLSNRINSIKPSPTISISNKALDLKAQGLNVISLSVGEPDFDTPDHIKEAAINAINSGQTKYTQVDGIPALKEAIIAKLASDNQLSYQKDQILVSSGAKHSLFNLFMATLNEGDEVIIPAPYWVSYPDMVTLFGAKPVIVETTFETGYKITPEQLETAITPRTKMFLMNSPSNPTGMCYQRDELEALGAVLERNNHMLVVTDDIYEKILWQEAPFCNLVTAAPALQDRAVVINGVSKGYAMTGWRIGYAAGPKEVIKAMKKAQGQSTSNPSSISQYAALEALSPENQACIADMVKAFKERHDYVLERVSKIKGLAASPADGAFYCFIEISAAIELCPGIDDDMSFCEQLLTEKYVASVPGSAFGQPGSMRTSFATSLEVLKEAFDRIEDFIKNKLP